MVHTVNTNIVLHLVGASCNTAFSGWVAPGTGTDCVISTEFVIPSVQKQELFQCFMHLLDTILHQPSEACKGKVSAWKAQQAYEEHGH